MGFSEQSNANTHTFPDPGYDASKVLVASAAAGFASLVGLPISQVPSSFNLVSNSLSRDL